jgi:hypothetical protein
MSKGRFYHTLHQQMLSHAAEALSATACGQHDPTDWHWFLLCSLTGGAMEGAERVRVLFSQGPNVRHCSRPQWPNPSILQGRRHQGTLSELIPPNLGEACCSRPIH